MAHASYYVVSACGELLLGLSCVDSCQPLDTGIEVFVQYRKTIIANLLTLPKLQDELTLANFSISSGLKLRNPDAHYIISENHAFGIELLTGLPGRTKFSNTSVFALYGARALPVQCTSGR